MPEILPTDISPATAPTPAPTATPPDSGGISPELAGLLEQDGDIPDDVLRIPAFNALLEGKPGALYANLDAKSPELATIVKHAPDLIKAGFGFYAADSKPVTVLFNSLALSIEDLAAADAAGRLDEVAAPFDEVKQSYDQLIAEDKATRTAAPAAAAPAAAPTVPGPSPAASPASMQNKIATARTENLTPGSPTGQGRILSALKKPVV